MFFFIIAVIHAKLFEEAVTIYFETAYRPCWLWRRQDLPVAIQPSYLPNTWQRWEVEIMKILKRNLFVFQESDELAWIDQAW